jgi:hypothetical protein
MTTVPTPSTPNYLDDGGLPYSPTGTGVRTGYGSVAGVAANVYIGAAATAWNGVAVLNVTGLATAAAQTYSLLIQGSIDDTFAAPVTLGSIQVAAVGQYLVPVYAYFGGVLYPYMRLEKMVTGASASITLNAFALPFSGLSSLSIQDATAVFGLAAQNTQEVAASIVAWASGTATGGPNGDGRYPIYDAAGDSVLVPCPAAEGPSSLTSAAVDGLPAATEATNGELIDTNPAWPVSVDNGSGGRQLKKINFFPARRTIDLQPLTTLIGTELLPATQVGGLEAQIALNTLQSCMSGGIINPTLPPYNCKFDAHWTSNIESTAGSAVLNCPDPIFQPSDVGKWIGLSNAGPSYGILQSTIISYQSPTQVTMAATATVSDGANYTVWGTDDTAGMQAALNAAVGPGQYLLGGAIMLPPRMALVQPLTHGPRFSMNGFQGLSGFFRRPVAGNSSPILSNATYLADFPVLRNLLFHGAKYLQANGSSGYVFTAATGTQTLPQIDPQPYFEGLRFQDCSSIGFAHYNRGAGVGKGLTVDSSSYYGFVFACYDMLYDDLRAGGCAFTGVYLSDYGTANNVFRGIYSYFNGGSAYHQGTGYPQDPTTTIAYQDACNLYVGGSSNLIEAPRIQESWGPNAVIGGTLNRLLDPTFDDTGDQYPADSLGHSTLMEIRPALMFLASASKNIVRDGYVDLAVKLSSNYATHALFLQNGASNNRITMEQQIDIGSYYPNGQTSGYYAPGVLGTDNPSGLGTNSVTIDGVVQT